MEKCYTFEGQSLENGLSYLYQATGNIFNLQQKQQNTEVKVRETDLIWSQICSSLLHYNQLSNSGQITYPVWIQFPHH